MHRVAQTCIDMKVQKHINMPLSTQWCRCSRVEFGDGMVKWELSRTGEYDLLESYQRSPHLQLAKATDDKALLAFVKAWGPLRTVRLPFTSGDDPIGDYRAERDLLAAEIRLVGSITQPELRRSALLAALDAFEKRDYTDARLTGMREHIGIPVSIPGKAIFFDPIFNKEDLRASDQQVDEACAYLVSTLPITDYSLKLIVERGKRRDTVRAWPGLRSLVDALHWMVWQDVFRERPFLFCDECDLLFQPDSEHEKKFCSTQCARRKASRDYERRKRAKERKSDGTHKTR